jgi:hypothetical protein
MDLGRPHYQLTHVAMEIEFGLLRFLESRQQEDFKRTIRLIFQDLYDMTEDFRDLVTDLERVLDRLFFGETGKESPDRPEPRSKN